VRTPSTNTMFFPVLSFTRGDAVDRCLIGTVETRQIKLWLIFSSHPKRFRNVYDNCCLTSNSRQTLCDTHTLESNLTRFFTKFDAIALVDGLNGEHTRITANPLLRRRRRRPDSIRNERNAEIRFVRAKKGQSKKHTLYLSARRAFYSSL